MSSPILKVHPDDTLIVALDNLPAGHTVTLDGESYTLPERIPLKHKFAARAFAPGDPVTMYGVLVGRATEAIPLGGLITTQNLTHAAGSYELRKTAPSWNAPDTRRWQGRTFEGYHRANGLVGTANYWLIVPLVFCENRNLEVMRASLVEALGYQTPRHHQVDVARLMQLHTEGAGPEAIMAAEIGL
ncbi:MAG: altronate dehydratase, partial [Bacteroidetes bacterium]